MDAPKHSGHFRVYSSRWVMLAIFSVLAMLNNFVCYSFAPIARIAHR